MVTLEKFEREIDRAIWNLPYNEERKKAINILAGIKNALKEERR